MSVGNVVQVILLSQIILWLSYGLILGDRE